MQNQSPNIKSEPESHRSNLSSSHQRILQRALEMHRQEEASSQPSSRKGNKSSVHYPKMNRELSNEKLIDRGLKIVSQDQNKNIIKYNLGSDQEEHLKNFRQNQDLNEKI